MCCGGSDESEGGNVQLPFELGLQGRHLRALMSKDSEVGSGDQVSSGRPDGLHGPDPWPVALAWL